MRLDISKDSQQKCRQYDVFFNGVLQRLCIFADEETGTIKRYVTGMGNRPIADKGRQVRTELLKGKVEIKRKQSAKAKQAGSKPDVDARAGVEGPGAEGSDPSNAESTPLGEAVTESPPAE